MRSHFARIAVIFAALTLFAVPVLAQSWTVLEDTDWCHEQKWHRACEVREATIPAGRDVIIVDAGKNGGIEVEGWDRNEILIRARIVVGERKLDRDEADQIVQDVEILVGDEIRADGPSRRGGQGWSVDFRVMVPERSNLVLESHNGGIEVVAVSGDIQLDTHNGGIRVGNVSGDVTGRTSNGGISVRLDGEAWDGEGLDLESRNGGINLEIPREYSADLLVGTKNGGIRSDFRLPRRDRDERGGTVRTTLGDGGALLRVITQNGGISVNAT